MHKFLGKIIAYTGWTLLGIILGVLLIGLIRFRGDVSGYISFLNTRDRSGPLMDNFRGSSDQTPAVSPIGLSGQDEIDGFTTGTNSTTGINAYDPNLEQEMNTPDSNQPASGDFGFNQPTTPDAQATLTAPTPTTSPDTSVKKDSQQLLNLIKNRELQQNK